MDYNKSDRLDSFVLSPSPCLLGLDIYTTPNTFLFFIPGRIVYAPT